MDKQEFINIIIEAVIVPLIVAIAAYVIKFIKFKCDELIKNNDNMLYNKYLSLLSQTIVNCVTATKQTYVDQLKKEGCFTLEAQKQAFSATYDAVMAILSDEAKNYLSEIINDLPKYITQQIEAEVAWTKKA